MNRQALIAFEAPYVVEKLVKNKSAASDVEARALFEEAKKYLWIVAHDREREYPIMSLRVDEAWHQFILFTREWREFCDCVLGLTVAHAPPTTLPPPEGAPVRASVSREEFVARYEEEFGPIPDLWFDERSVSPDVRVLANPDTIAPIEVRVRDGRAEIVEASSGVVRMRVDAWAEAALRFVLERGIVYVRELPGIDEDDSVVLCRALVAAGILLVVA
jgi:hypothetical protein